MELREKQLTEGRRDAGTRPPWASRPRPPPPPSRASRRLCTPSLASSALRSSRTGTPAAFLGSCPLDDGELRHGGSHASHTASNKGRRRRRGYLTEHVPRRVMLFVSLRSRDSARWHWQGPRGQHAAGVGASVGTGRRLEFPRRRWKDLVEGSSGGGETFRRKGMLHRA
jgi:hypothetical protein